MHAYTIEKDGTARSLNGNVIFFSFEKFENEICQNGNCFVCGALPNNSFNDEHVFPNWLLRKTGIHNKELILPNELRTKYASYKIPCCEVCNSNLGKIYEEPLSKVFSGGYESLIEYLKSGGHSNLCSWLSLIFFKVHLKDFQNSNVLDQRIDKGFIGDEYDLHELHHIHAVARSPIANIEIDEDVFGSLVIINIENKYNEKVYDYCDNLAARTIMLRVNDVALIYVLDDCGAASNMLSEQLKRVPAKLTDLQLREMYARYAAANLHIKSQPIFKTQFVEKPRIKVDLPEFEIFDYEPTVFGSIFANVLQNYKNNIIIDGKSGNEVIEKIKEGHITFLQME